MASPVRVVLLPPPGAGAEPGLVDALAGGEVVRYGGGPLRCDAVVVTADPGAAQPGALAAPRAFAARGGPVLGVGGGFAALCAAGLPPLRVSPGLCGRSERLTI